MELRGQNSGAYNNSNPHQPNQESSSSAAAVTRRNEAGHQHRSGIQSGSLDNRDQHLHQLTVQPPTHRPRSGGHPNPIPDSDPADQLGFATSNSTTPPSPPPPRPPIERYRECLKNHAASIGAHVVDGCGEFMPNGAEGTPEAFKCAACECHRNFHRKEIEGESQPIPNSHYSYNPNSLNNNSRSAVVHHAPPRTSFPTLPPPQHQQHHNTHAVGHKVTGMMMAFGGNSGAPAESSSEDLNMLQSNAGAQPSYLASKKRFRTKFSKEQKDRMTDFAEKLEWKIQKKDEQEVHQFCNEVGIKRQVFKVWMHNNKQAMKKKQQQL